VDLSLSLLVAVALALKKTKSLPAYVSRRNLEYPLQEASCPSPTTGHTACRNLNNPPSNQKIWYGCPALPCNFVYSALGSTVPAC